METMDFSGTSDMSKTIQKDEIIIEEKKLGESQMMEFTSSIDDLIGPPETPQNMQDGIYTNPSNGRVSGISLDDGKPAPKKKSNPFGLTNEQYTAAIAGIVAALSTSSMIQEKVQSMVPNPQGINGTIATALVAAFLFFFAMKFLNK